MKILIVNGHSNNYNGQKRFQEFVALIKDVTKHIHINEIGLYKTKAINGVFS